MLTKDERNQIRNFEDAVAEIVDQYLKQGMDPTIIARILRSEASSDLFRRREELDA